jgi:hypothetical protein
LREIVIAPERRAASPGRETKLWSTLAHDLHGRTTDDQLGADEDALTVVSSYDDAFGRLKKLEAYRANAPTVKLLNQHHTRAPTVHPTLSSRKRMYSAVSSGVRGATVSR